MLDQDSNFYLEWVFSSPVSWIMYWYSWEKLHVNHFWELRVKFNMVNKLDLAIIYQDLLEDKLCVGSCNK